MRYAVLVLALLLAYALLLLWAAGLVISALTGVGEVALLSLALLALREPTGRICSARVQNDTRPRRN